MTEPTHKPIAYEEATPFEVSHEQALSLLKSRVKNPEWTIAFCLASDYDGMLMLGELLRPLDMDLEAETLEIPLYTDVMVAFCLAIEGYPEALVSHYCGDQPSTPLLRPWPSVLDHHERIICANFADYSTMFHVFIRGLMEAEEVN